jgi:hypothetical protein
MRSSLNSRRREAAQQDGPRRKWLPAVTIQSAKYPSLAKVFA